MRSSWHFGRPGFPWEETGHVEGLRDLLNLKVGL